jgi:hypothetical protein
MANTSTITIELEVDTSALDVALEKMERLIANINYAQHLMDTQNHAQVPAIDNTVKPCPRCHSHMLKDTSSFSFPFRTPYLCPACNYREIGL